MKTIPAGAKPYQRTKEFSEDSVPKGLLRDHSTKPEVWGRICVLAGRLEYTIQTSPSETLLLSPGFDGIVEPEMLHFVKPIGAVRFFVEFWREDEAEETDHSEPPENRALRVREEQLPDQTAVRRIHEAAFEQPDEAALVEALRRGEGPSLSLVAEVAEEVVGHVFLSPVEIDAAPQDQRFAGLAPLGVLPAFQNQGVGSALMREAIRLAPSRGWSAIFLLGDPAYYARFGFTLAGPLGLHFQSAAFDTGFQVLKLEQDALRDCEGLVHYDAAFAAL